MAIVRKIIKKAVQSIAAQVSRLLVRLHISKPRVIIYVDGGLCSQMNMWVQGQYYAEHGYDVYYDLEWYRRCGKGIDGVSIRQYELERLWPKLQVKKMPRTYTRLYQYFLSWPEASIQLPDATKIDRSIYFNGYNKLTEQEKIRLFRKYFTIQTAALTPKMNIDANKRYCGVHARRGDLKNISTPFYPQVKDGYFIRAIEYVDANVHIDEFFLFSDDTQWLIDNILPYVKVKCRIMEGNRAYEDLMLLAQCQIIIASQGSFGATAALINPNCEILIRNVEVSKLPYAQNEIQII